MILFINNKELKTKSPGFILLGINIDYTYVISPFINMVRFLQIFPDQRMFESNLNIQAMHSESIIIIFILRSLHVYECY